MSDGGVSIGKEKGRRWLRFINNSEKEVKPYGPVFVRKMKEWRGAMYFEVQDEWIGGYDHVPMCFAGPAGIPAKQNEVPGFGVATMDFPAMARLHEEVEDDPKEGLSLGVFSKDGLHETREISSDDVYGQNRNDRDERSVLTGYVAFGHTVSDENGENRRTLVAENNVQLLSVKVDEEKGIMAGEEGWCVLAADHNYSYGAELTTNSPHLIWVEFSIFTRQQWFSTPGARLTENKISKGKEAVIYKPTRHGHTWRFLGADSEDMGQGI